MQDPRENEQPIGFTGKALVVMFLTGALIVARAIWDWAYSLWGPALYNAAGLAGVALLALLVGYIAGQESRS